MNAEYQGNEGFLQRDNTWNNTSFLSDGVILPKEVSHITDYIITLGTR